VDAVYEFRARAATVVPPRSDAGDSVSDAFDAALAADPRQARESIATLSRELAARGMDFGGGQLPVALKPHFLAASRDREWTGLVTRFLEAAEKVGRRVLEDPSSRSQTLFRPECWRLFDIDPGYQRLAVVCRPDMVWDAEGGIKLLELNTDSPAMMSYADHVQNVVRELFPMRGLAGSVQYNQRIPSLLRALLEAYREWGGSKAQPTIAIVDWPNQKTREEQTQLALDFGALGCPSFTCAPHELELRGGRLYGRGEPIDIVQRRVLFPEVVARRDELAPLLHAYRERLVCMVNPLRSYLLGCKAVLAELYQGSWRAWLDEEDRHVVDALVPVTRLVDSKYPRELREKEQWVLKPAFGSGGNGVAIGRFMADPDWRKALELASGSQWIAQSFLSIPTYSVPLMVQGKVAVHQLYANWNPFFFGGAYGGSIARVSAQPIVSITSGGALLPTVVARD
jgi:glutathionylspermidine synthase